MANSRVDEIQQTLDRAGNPWIGGDTGVSSEQARIMCGFVPGPEDDALPEREEIARRAYDERLHFQDAALPASIDLRTYMSPVRNQGSCGSCVAFGTVAAVEGTIRYRKMNPSFSIELSEAHLFYCHAAAEGRTCGYGHSLFPISSGWWPPRALIAFQQKGVVSRSCFPYDPQHTPLDCKPCSQWSTCTTYISAHRRITDVSEMKRSLQENGPLVACLTVYDDFALKYKGGVYRRLSGAKSVGGHCIVLYGFDDSRQCWLGKNSWDTAWGANGHFEVAYGECGIDSEMWAVYVD